MGEEELALHHAPGAKTGLLGVQEVDPGCYQAKIRKKSGSGFVLLPACNSVLLAAWFFAKAFHHVEIPPSLSQEWRTRERGQCIAQFVMYERLERMCADMQYDGSIMFHWTECLQHATRNIAPACYDSRMV